MIIISKPVKQTSAFKVKYIINPIAIHIIAKIITVTFNFY